MKKELPSQIRLKHFRNFFYSVCFLLMSINVGWGQKQTLGSFPYMDGGFEGQTATAALGGTVSTTAWSYSGSSAVNTTRAIINDASVARTGNKYANHVTSSTTIRLQSPSTATESAAPAVNTQYTVQYYFKTTTDPATGLNRGGIYNDGTNSSITVSTIVGTWSSNVWTKAYSTLTTNTTRTTPYAATGFGAVRTAIASSNLYDDFVIYPGAYDATAPTPATASTVSIASATTFNVGWTASADADKTGYMVVRYTADPTGQPLPNVNGIYGVTNTIGTGTVVYIGGTETTSFIDTVADTAVTHYYRIFTVDKAFNYSSALDLVTQSDNTPPGNPGAVTVSGATATTLAVSWNAATSIDGGGYLVVRYATSPNADNDPTQKTTYAVGNTFTNGTGGLSGTVVYVGTGLLTTDTGLTTDVTYYYKVYTFDQAKNYSEESSGTGATTAAADDTPPNAPGIASITNQTLSTMTTNWIAASGGVDGGGYMVVRYSGDPSLETGADPVQKTSYAVNDIIATGTPPVTDPVTLPKNGKVVYIGTDLSYVSTGLSPADTSHFKIYTFDASYNYSTASFVSGKTATAIATPVALASSLSTATGFTANWIVAPVVSTYNVNVYSAAASASTIVGWTITDGTQTTATSVLASATTTNNTTNTLTQNGGGAINTTVSGNPGFAARGATYYSTLMVSGTEGVDAVYASPKVAPDKYWQITANTVGYKNVTISSDQYSTNTGPRDWKLQYSSTGTSGTFTDLGTTLTLPNAVWDSSVSNIALPAECDNNPNVVIRWVQTSFTNTTGDEMTTPSTGGTSRIDNILVKGTKLTLVKAVTEGNNVATSKTITGLDAGTYYYDVVVSKDDVTGTTGIVSKYITSANSNLIQGATLSPLTAPVASATSNPTESGFTANWGAVAGATDYRFYLYGTPTQSDIVGWNFDTNLVATTTSTNNTTNTVVQSKGTATVAAVAGNTSVTATTSAWTPVSGLASGTNWEIQVNTLGYYNTTVSSKQYASQAATAARDFKVQYKIGANGTYADVPSASIIVAKDWTTGVLNNVALPVECDNQPLVYLRWINYTTLATDGINTITSGGISLDDVYVRGRNLTIESGYPVTVSGTSTVLTGLAQGNYYYDVIARGDNSTTSNSIKSNLISGIVYLSPTEANFRSTASGNLTSSDIWEYYNGTAWVTATSAPTSANSITIQAGHTVTLTSDFVLNTEKSLTISGTLDLAGFNVSGSGATVTSNSNSKVILGNNVSLTSGITTSTVSLNTDTDFDFNGTTVAQHTGGLPGSTLSTSSSNGSQNYTTTLTGNITVSNPLGVTMNQSIRLNTPGTLTVTSTGKFAFGDGNVASETIASGTLNSGSFNLTGSGSFVAESDCTLVITSSKGISGTTDGNIRTSTARTFGSGINFVFAKNDGLNPISIGTSFYNGDINPATGIKNMTIDCPYGVYFASTYTGTANDNTTGFVSTLTYTGGNDITVNGTLNFVSGKLYTGDYVTVATNSVPAVVVNSVGYYPVVSLVITPGNTSTLKLNIGQSGSVTGASQATGWVVGNLKKTTASGSSPSFTYAIGNSTNYSPLALTFSGNTSATGNLTASTASSDHAQLATSGLDASKSVNKNWTLTNDGLAGFGTYDAIFGYSSTDIDSGSTPAIYTIRLYDGATWSNSTVSGTPNDTAATATGITGFGDFAIGECTPTTEGSVNTSICSGASYTWPANGQTYTTAQNGTTFVSGCNTATLNLTINQLTTEGSVTTSINAGESYTWPANGQTYTTAQNGTTFVSGCNTATLNLTVITTQIPSGPLSLCKGATVASVTGTTSLKFYAASTGGTALVATTAFATKTYYVTETISGVESTPRTAISVTVNNLPATPSALVSSESLVICKYIGSSTPVTFNATAANAVSYIWNVPSGASIVSGDGTASIGVSFAGASTTAGAIGSVTVQIQDANNCVSLSKALALTTKVPTAPTALTMKSADSTPSFKGIITPATESTPAVYGLVGLNTLASITKVGPYVGTSTVFTLTAPAASTAASYLWTLPEGVNQLSGGTSNEITVNFAGVTPGTTALPISVQSVGGCGNSTNRTLSLARVIPTAPTALVLTNSSQANLSSLAKITKVGPYTGTPIAFTLTATPFTTQGSEATSYAWILPSGVNCISANTPTTVLQKVSVPTAENPLATEMQPFVAISTPTNTITVNFSGVTGTGNLDLKVFGINGAGNSIARTLTLARALPTAPTKLVLTDDAISLTTAVTKAGAYTAKETPLTLTVTPFTTQGAEATSYSWVLPAGVNVTAGASLSIDNGTTKTWTGTESVLTINLAGIGIGVTSIPLHVYAVNGAGTSTTARTLTLTSAAPATPAITASATTFSTCAGTTTTYTATAIPGATYTWGLPGGATGSSTTNSIVVDFTGVTTAASYTITCIATNGTGPSLSKSLIIKKSTAACRLVTESSVAEDFTVIAYPNPSASEFTIESSSKGATTVQVYDMMGRLIENAQANANTVQVGRNYAAGTYNVIVSQGAKAKTLKVIKK